MIKLTRLSNEPFILNAELIRFVEARPDTFVTLTTGDKLVVKESMDEVLALAIRYQQTKNLFPLPRTRANAEGDGESYESSGEPSPSSAC